MSQLLIRDCIRRFSMRGPQDLVYRKGHPHYGRWPFVSWGQQVASLGLWTPDWSVQFRLPPPLLLDTDAASGGILPLRRIPCQALSLGPSQSFDRTQQGVGGGAGLASSALPYIIPLVFRGGGGNLRHVTKRVKKLRCERCRKLFLPPSKGRRPKYCSQSCRQRAYEARRAQQIVPEFLLGRDMEDIRTKAGVERAVVDVLREHGFLPPSPKTKTRLRVVRKKDEV